MDFDKIIICDVDGTICEKTNGRYEDAVPDRDFISVLNSYYEQGFTIKLFTSRNMSSFDGDLRKIEAVTRPILELWLQQNGCKYHELIMGKPWCGRNGFYIDDKSIRPDEFKKLDYSEISKLVSQ